MIYILKNQDIQVCINSLGAEMISAKGNEGYEYVWSGNEWEDHAPLLFPTCGRLLGGKYLCKGKEYFLSSHGFAKKSEFALVEKSESSVKLSLSANESTREVYPFDFTLVAEYRLDGKRLNVSFSVTNLGDEVMPYMFGWHPGFTLWGNGDISEFYLDFGNYDSLPLHPLQNGCFVNPEAIEYSLKNGKYFINDDELAEVDTLIFKKAGGKVCLCKANCERRVELGWSDNLPYFCVWKAPGKSVRFICLEPWSDVPADGFTEENFETRNMSRLSPKSTETYNYTVKFN